MDPIQEHIRQSRRSFLTTTASGIGHLALLSLLKQDGLLAEESGSDDSANPLAPKKPHFEPKAKNCIFIFLAGAPSQVDLFDPKPKLDELDGEPLPDSMLEEVRFAFIQKKSAVLMGTPRKFHKYGECGMEFSDLVPNIASCADDIAMIRSMHTEAFNHHPGQLMMNTGVPTFGRPSVGAWLNYGLGTTSQNLPGYVVLTAGRGTSGGASNWTSGFLPSSYQGVLFRTKGDPVLHLGNPPGIDRPMQQKGLEAISELNRHRLEQVGDPEIASRIASYELAYRMQSAAPELIDLSDESEATKRDYGIIDRPKPPAGSGRGGSKNTPEAFATNCLLARRMVERGVRFINLYHASWDHHSNLDDGLAFNTHVVDQPVGALLKDLKQRGLLDDTLVVFAGEFGRTPLGENRPGRKANTGRDHHPFAFSLWMAGGGVRGGQVYGATDEIGWKPVENPVHINDFHATLLHLFGLDHLKLTYRFQGRDFRLTDVAGKVLDPLVA